jgi:hypothetical protein
MLVPPTKVLVLVVLGLVVLVLAEAVAALLTLEVLGLVLVPVYKLVVVPVVAPVLVLLLTGKSKVLGLLTSWGGVEGQEGSKEASAG